MPRRSEFAVPDGILKIVPPSPEDPFRYFVQYLLELPNLLAAPHALSHSNVQIYRPAGLAGLGLTDFEIMHIPTLLNVANDARNTPVSLVAQLAAFVAASRQLELPGRPANDANWALADALPCIQISRVEVKNGNSAIGSHFDSDRNLLTVLIPDLYEAGIALQFFQHIAEELVPRSRFAGTGLLVLPGKQLLNAIAAEHGTREQMIFSDWCDKFLSRQNVREHIQNLGGSLLRTARAASVGFTETACLGFVKGAMLHSLFKSTRHVYMVPNYRNFLSDGLPCSALHLVGTSSELNDEELHQIACCLKLFQARLDEGNAAKTGTSKSGERPRYNVAATPIERKAQKISEPKPTRNRYSSAAAAEQNPNSIVGVSAHIISLREKVMRAAACDLGVLIIGETGTGKGLLAKEIHNHSGRRAHRFVKVNCTAIPAALFESEMFGRAKGAFTGAMTESDGYFMRANGGTLLLDEIGDVPKEIQPKLLSALEDGRFMRVGSSKDVEANVRIIAATNRDLKTEMEAGQFRRDLFYRLSAFPITILPLRERPEDILPLVEFFLDVYSKKTGKKVAPLRVDLVEHALLSYQWKGNVREIVNTVEHAFAVSGDQGLDFAHYILSHPDFSRATEPRPFFSGNDPITRLNPKDRQVLECLQACRFNLRETAKCLWQVSGASVALKTLGRYLKEILFHFLAACGWCLTKAIELIAGSAELERIVASKIKEYFFDSGRGKGIFTLLGHESSTGEQEIGALGIVRKSRLHLVTEFALLVRKRVIRKSEWLHTLKTYLH